MSSYPVIGIAGLARSGKDTVANYILAARGYGYRYGFADPIKAMLIPLGIDCTDPYWTANKEAIIPSLGVSLRYLMQTLGTEWGRRLVNDDLWVTLAKSTVMTHGPGMIIPDVRFENEAAWIRAVGGRVIHLERDNRPQVLNHDSERGIARHAEDVVIKNNGSLQDLHQAITEMFNGTGA